MCHKCRIFLYDFLQLGLHKDLELTKQIRVKSLSKALPEFVDWMLRMNEQIEMKQWKTAQETSLRIARRGRKAHDYEFLIYTATFNFLKFSHSWIGPEVDYMKSILIDAGCLKGREHSKVLRYAQDYVAFLLARSLHCLKEIHDDHTNPKGLFTDVSNKFQPKLQEEDEETCYDRDDYQREILEEDTDDLYT